MKWKRKLFIIGIILALIGLSFAPLFDGLNFWEWLWKELSQKLHGENEVEPDGEECPA